MHGVIGVAGGTDLLVYVCALWALTAVNNAAVNISGAAADLTRRQLRLWAMRRRWAAFKRAHPELLEDPTRKETLK